MVLRSLRLLLQGVHRREHGPQDQYRAEENLRSDDGLQGVMHHVGQCRWVGSDVDIALGGKLDGGRVEGVAEFLLALEDGHYAVLSVQVVEGDLLGNHHNHEEGKSTYKHPEGGSEIDLHLHDCQSKDVQSYPNEIETNCHDMPQVVLLPLSLPRPPYEISHHPVDVIGLHDGTKKQQREGERADDQQLLEDGLAVDISGQAELVDELEVGLVVVQILLLSIEHIDVDGELSLHDEAGFGIIEEKERDLDDCPLVVGHGEYKHHKDQQVDYRCHQHSILEDLVAPLVLGHDQVLLPARALPAHQPVEVVHALSTKKQHQRSCPCLMCCQARRNSIDIMGNIPCCSQKTTVRPPEVHPHPPQPDPPHPAPDRITSARETTTHLPRETLAPARGRGPEDYQSRKYLGRGAFGCVVLAEEKESGRLFAMKIIEKSKIREFNVLQCELMQRIGRQDFLVGIRETFQNQSRIYIIMEYLPKGDLYFYLRKKEIPFTQPTIRGILAEIVVGVGILHSYGLIYRELKPQNLLVTEEGHLKLTDYGLSKVIVEHEQSVETFVGTLEYMAPEALKGQFGQKADIWSLGVLMFELMFRENPFEAEQRPQKPLQEYKASIDSNLINSRVNAKIGYMSLAFRDLLLRLIEKDPEKRLTLQQVRGHDFFRQTDWGAVQHRTNPPPLQDIVEKHDYISFRDATNEEYLRSVAHHRHTPRDYQFTLYEFRNSH